MFDTTTPLASFDPEIAAAIAAEERRQEGHHPAQEGDHAHKEEQADADERS